MIMSSEPLADVIPLLKRPADGAMITQFDYPTCESLGLIKMDFLGLRNLTVLDDCVHNIEVNRGETVVLEDLPLDDAESYQLLGTGDTLGVFQLDGGPMRSLLRLDAARQLRGHLRGRSRSTAPARWASTPTTSTPGARTASRRSTRSTASSPSRSRRSSSRPTA